MDYEKYDLTLSARLALNYLTRMVDEKYDYLPYWLIQITKAPGWARHCRVDDAELVASWYEAIWCVRNILGTEEGAEVQAGFKRHIYRHWKDGLRYHEPYPWTHTMHHSFHEDGYLLPALNRIIAGEGDEQARTLSAALVRALRGLVYERKTRCFWFGDSDFEEPVYEFPNDIYLKDRGFDQSCVTGRGETAVRNGLMLHALVRNWQLTGDEVSLDLATGLANHLCGISRYFNYKGEFFGHVHSALCVSAGLILLGRLKNVELYRNVGRGIYRYVRDLSSSFGWVPEYAQWHPMEEEHCETCCIRDMIMCGFELIDDGDDEPYDLINRFVRNQLYEQQVKTGSFVGVDNDRKDDDPSVTYRDIDQRVVGGWSGGAEPNSISLSRFRSIAGCCVGTAPQALHQVWQRIVEARDGEIYVNFPIETVTPLASVAIGYPNDGRLTVHAGRAGNYRVRLYPFMGDAPSVTLDGREVSATRRNGCLRVEGVQKGQRIDVTHALVQRVEREHVRGVDLSVTWRGCDVVELDPPGEPLRLYQRVLNAEKDIPAPPPCEDAVVAIDVKPTEQRR